MFWWITTVVCICGALLIQYLCSSKILRMKQAISIKNMALRAVRAEGERLDEQKTELSNQATSKPSALAFSNAKSPYRILTSHSASWKRTSTAERGKASSLHLLRGLQPYPCRQNSGVTDRLHLLSLASFSVNRFAIHSVSRSR
jgi:hypothetical protein